MVLLSLVLDLLPALNNRFCVGTVSLSPASGGWITPHEKSFQNLDNREVCLPPKPQQKLVKFRKIIIKKAGSGFKEHLLVVAALSDLWKQCKQLHAHTHTAPAIFP